MKGLYLCKLYFIDFMIDFLNPDNSEFMFHIVACI